MTKQEAQDAIIQEKTVIFNDIKYSIRGLIYRYEQTKRKWIVSAELLDKNEHSIIITRLEKIKLYQEQS